MRIIVACEYSQVVCQQFRLKGHDAYSCDLLPTEGDPKYHIQCDILDIINDSWDMMIAFPDCTYLCGSGLHWNKRRPERANLTEQAIEFVNKLLNAPIDKIALENPVGCLSSRIRKPDQIIQPYDFGDDASKKTCLWLKNLPKLKPTKYIEPRIVNNKKRWANQTDSGQNKLGPSEDRWKIRSKTYLGIAKAMSEQWI